MQLTKQQLDLISEQPNGAIFLSGDSGTGKTTAAMQRMLFFIKSDIPASSILVLTPQRSLANPYILGLQNNSMIHGQPVTLLTMGGLARRMVALYWPLINELAGFNDSNVPPAFLTMESSQYFMAHLVLPLLQKGYFSNLTIDFNRLYSQIIDNINKSAIVGFPYTEISSRLKSAWLGDSSQLVIYDQVQDCINQFRSFCLQNNLLDYSLQIELFRSFIWPSRIFRTNLFSSFQHLIYDGSEEDPPFVHELVREWLPELESCLILFDKDGGYRHFLGANPPTAQALSELCNSKVEFSSSFITPQLISKLKANISKYFLPSKSPLPSSDLKLDDLKQTLIIPEQELRFYPQMIDWVVAKVQALVTSGTQPKDIVILAPYMSDMLKFSLTNHLEALNIPFQTHRPSRALRDDPATQCYLTLTAFANPEWNISKSKFELAYALMQAIHGLDLVRAHLLANGVLEQDSDAAFSLKPFDRLPAPIRDRITFKFGENYDRLRLWLFNTDLFEPLDVFISRLFGEVLSQPGYCFHQNIEGGRITANLIDSIRKFRWAMNDAASLLEFNLGKEYLKMVTEGVIAAQYVTDWDLTELNAVLIAPAYTFLMHNRAVNYQFWLDINSSGWYERLEQPLTHPYVLSPNWQTDQKWTAQDEMQVSQNNLERMVLGLLSHCRKNVFLGISSLNQNGTDERGLLTRLIQTLFRQVIRGGNNV
ncbi:MAG: hypothetical protein MUO40_06760 [Anaerolineaceae bacterium]|nr:hypothetical protein [Anaerolineaceae bacterium]